MNISNSLKDFLFETVLNSKEYMYFTERHKPRVQKRFKQLLMNGYIGSTKQQIVKSVCRILKTFYNNKQKKKKEKQMQKKEQNKKHVQLRQIYKMWEKKDCIEQDKLSQRMKKIASNYQRTTFLFKFWTLRTFSPKGRQEARRILQNIDQYMRKHNGKLPQPYYDGHIYIDPYHPRHCLHNA